MAEHMNENTSVSWSSIKSKKKTTEELEDYNRRIEEVFRKHGLMPKRVYGKGYKAFFLNETRKEDPGKSTDQ